MDGSECDWGRVLACDPPRRIVVAWQTNVNGDAWVYDPDPSHVSEFEVTFREQPDGQTRVELEHRNAVLRCCTGHTKGRSRVWNRPLSWARSEGLEPPTF